VVTLLSQHLVIALVKVAMPHLVLGKHRRVPLELWQYRPEMQPWAQQGRLLFLSVAVAPAIAAVCVWRCSTLLEAVAISHLLLAMAARMEAGLSFKVAVVSIKEAMSL